MANHIQNELLAFTNDNETEHNCHALLSLLTGTVDAILSKSLWTVATERANCVDTFTKLAHCLSPALVDIYEKQTVPVIG